MITPVCLYSGRTTRNTVNKPFFGSLYVAPLATPNSATMSIAPSLIGDHPSIIGVLVAFLSAVAVGYVSRKKAIAQEQHPDQKRLQDFYHTEANALSALIVRPYSQEITAEKLLEIVNAVSEAPILKSKIPKNPLGKAQYSIAILQMLHENSEMVLPFVVDSQTPDALIQGTLLNTSVFRLLLSTLPRRAKVRMEAIETLSRCAGQLEPLVKADEPHLGSQTGSSLALGNAVIHRQIGEVVSELVKAPEAVATYSVTTEEVQVLVQRLATVLREISRHQATTGQNDTLSQVNKALQEAKLALECLA